MPATLKIQGQLKIQGIISFDTINFWKFLEPLPGTTLINFQVKTSGPAYTVNWGDGTTTTVSSFSAISHTF